MRLAITGAHTPVGALLCRSLGAEHEITAIGRQTEAPQDLGSSSYLGVDVRLPEDAKRAVDGSDVVIHAEPHDVLAGQPQADDALVLDLAARGTYVLVEAAREVGVRRLVLISHLKLMEDYPEQFVVSESWQPYPRGEAASLAPYTAELVCREIARTGSIEAICLRFGELDAAGGTSADDAVAAVSEAIHRDKAGRGYSWALHHVASSGRFAPERG